MTTTIFLAQIWGPIILAIGLGIFVSRNYYIKIYRDLDQNTLAVLVFGIMATAVGIIHIGIHNVWGSFTEVVITLLGWGTLLKGLAFIIVPNLVDKAGDWEVKSKLVPTAGIITIAIGVYLSWAGYFV